MSFGPKNAAEAKTWRYGRPTPWGPAPQYNPAHCAASVWQNWANYQCTRKPGHGPDGLWCKQHAKQHEEAAI